MTGLQLTPVHVCYGPATHIDDVRMEGRAGAMATIVSIVITDKNLSIVSLDMPGGQESEIDILDEDAESIGDALVEAVLRLEGDRVAVRRMGEEARRKAELEYRAETHMERLMKTFEKARKAVT